MPAFIFELNDAEVRVGHGGKIIARSPGYAVVRDEGVFLGAAAQRLAHLHPRQTFNRFWTSLNQDALALPARQFRHHADLAHAHLMALHEQAGKPAEAVLAVPGGFSSNQLSLLLGVAQSCPFTTVGLVDSAVAAAAATGPGSYLHVDLRLHQTILTHIDIGDRVIRGAVETIDDGGLAGIWDTATAFIADLFVQHCRFDPMRHAETEQALYDKLPLCFQALSSRQETPLEIQFRNTGHQIKLTRPALLAHLDAHYQATQARFPAGRIPLLGDRIAALPGFAARLPQARVLDATSVLQGCERNLAAILSSPPNLNYVTRLPLSDAALLNAPDTAVTAPATSGRTVTHVLSGHSAWPLREQAIYLSTSGDVSGVRQGASACAVALNNHSVVMTPLTDISSYLNGARLTGKQTLVAGDKVSFAGADTVYTFISITDPHGA